MKLTKIDAAEANIIEAVRIHFHAGHLASVMVLANSAREIVATIGEKIGAETAHAKIAARFGKSIPEVIAPLSKAAGFLKHADRQTTKSFELIERDVEMTLYLASLDFAIVAKGLPIEAQVYEGWFLAKGIRKVSAMGLRKQALIRDMIRHFPGIRRAAPTEQKKIGLNALKKAQSNPSLKMQIVRDVDQIIAEAVVSPAGGC